MMSELTMSGFKLYYNAESSAAACFIASYVGKVSIECETVAVFTSHITASNVDFYTINPKGNVPSLISSDKPILNENSAILQWIADQVPGTIAPHRDEFARYELQNVLNYIGSEVHPSFHDLYEDSYPPEVQKLFVERAVKRLEYLDKVLLTGKSFLVNDILSVADIYLYVVLSWIPTATQIKFDDYPLVKEYFERISELPVMKEAIARMSTNPSFTY